MTFLFEMVYAISAVITLGLLCISIYKSKENKATYFSFFILHIFIYVIGVALEINSFDTYQATFANVIQYLGISFIPPYFLLFVCEYSEKPLTNKMAIGSLFVIPIISFILVLTYPLNNLFYEEFNLISTFGISHLSIKSSIYRDLSYLYFVILIAMGFIVTFYTYSEGINKESKRIAFIIKGTIIPFILVLMYLFNLTPYGLDFTPIAFVFISLYYGYHILFKNVFLSLPYARYNVLENMYDGFLLIDINNNYIDSNARAKVLFPSLESAIIGINVSNFKGLPRVISQNNGTKSIIEFPSRTSTGIKYYDFNSTTFYKNKRNELRCWLIHDVTREKELRDKLVFMANHDTLTEIYNRKIFLRKSNDLFYENIKGKKSFAILMIDIDYFKKVNDTYGHYNGDAILVQVAKILVNNFRASDVFARYGGEEFIVFLEDVRKEEALHVGENLRKTVEENNFTINENIVNITISIGIAMYNPRYHNHIDDVINSSDKFLYESKNGGRNRVTIG
ncbi:MAG: diguanylate cyclase [Lachnospirales bacterium]